mmetsp:Transcript_22114/g.56056  ORF Transcript_22114/g.56056 Transcript_22114/m.56056 type:complete len:317 (-) Transcript_22114:209-1159(-)
MGDMGSELPGSMSMPVFEFKRRNVQIAVGAVPGSMSLSSFSFDLEQDLEGETFGRLARPRTNSIQIGGLGKQKRMTILLGECDELTTPPTVPHHVLLPDVGVGAGHQPLEALFPLEKAQVIAAVACRIFGLLSHDRSLPVPEEIAIFDESKVEGPAFHGSLAEIVSLLETMLGVGLEQNTLVVANIFIERLCRLVSNRREETRLIPVSAARAMILTMLLLASKFNFDVGVRMKDVRANSTAYETLGLGLVKMFSKLEEHVLILFNWQLRVTASDFAAHYDRLSVATRSTEDGSMLRLRVCSVPMMLNAYGGLYQPA